METAPPDNPTPDQKTRVADPSPGLTAHPLFGELRLYAAAGVKTPITELAAEFEKASGRRIALFFDTAGAALGIYNTEESVRGFALSCMNFALERGYPVYLGTKNTELEHYDGLFKNTFQEVYDTRFRKRFEAKGIHYEHRMVDELAAFAIRSAGGFVWACKNYDGDVQSDMVAAGFGSLGLMASMLLTPDGKTVLTEAAHGTITRHFREHQAGRETSTNPVALLFAWTRAIYYRGLFDETPAVQAFAATLEKACIDTVESGQMTKDLAVLTGSASWLTTRQFLAKIKGALDSALSGQGWAHHAAALAGQRA